MLALPFADADLVATSRGNLTDLTTAAGTLGTRRVAEILGVTPVPDTSWPADGVADERTVADLATRRHPGPAARRRRSSRAVLPAAASPASTGSPATAPLAVGLDPIAQRRSPRGTPPTTPARAAGRCAPVPPAPPAPLSTQDAVGALALRALEDVVGASAPPVTVVAPPPRWAAGPADAAPTSTPSTTSAGGGLVRPVDLGKPARPGRHGPATSPTPGR